MWVPGLRSSFPAIPSSEWKCWGKAMGQKRSCCLLLCPLQCHSLRGGCSIPCVSVLCGHNISVLTDCVSNQQLPHCISFCSGSCGPGLGSTRNHGASGS